MKNLLLFFFVLMLFSCATRQEKSYNYYQKNKGELAQLCNDEFPFREEYIPGIPEVKTDTVYSKKVVEIPCPEPTPENPKPTVKCPPEKTIIKEIYIRDTIKVESSRKTKALEFEIQKLKKELQKKEEAIQKQNKQISKYKNFKTIGWTLSLLLLGIGLVIRIFK